MLEKIKAVFANIVAGATNLVSIAKSKKSVVAALIVAILYFKQPPTALMICLTLITMTWIICQTIMDVKGKKQ